MTKTYRLGMCLLTLLACAQVASAQTADEIIEKYLTAIGGRTAMSKLTSRVSTGTITVSTPGGDLSGSIQMYTAAPNKTRSLTTIDASTFNLGTIVIDQRFDGTAGYVIDTFQGNRDIAGPQLEGMKKNMFPSPLMNYREQGISVEFGGREKVGDRDALVLVIKATPDLTMRQYHDAETYLPIKQVVSGKLDAGPVDQLTEFLAYKDFDGLKIPVKIHQAGAGQEVTIYVTSVEHNVAIDPATFAKPANAQ